MTDPKRLHPAARITAGMRSILDKAVSEINAEARANTATTQALARREREIRDRAGERKDAER